MLYYFVRLHKNGPREGTMTITAKVAMMLTAAGLVCGAAPAGQMGQPGYKDAKRSPEQRAADLLGRMTVDEKVGQMTQGDSMTLRDPGEVAELLLGSVLSGGDSEPPDTSARGWTALVAEYQNRALGTRLGIPIIYGIDAVHGHTNVRGAVAFPHNIGLGCTRNPRIVEQASRVTALEILATGMHWDFAPCVAVPQDERWGRTYEGYGESPELAELLGPAAVRGLQGASRPWRVLATAKHFVGDGGTTGGVDQGNTEVDEETLRYVHLPGYEAAIKAGVGSIMVSFNSWNGQKMHGHKWLLTDVLRGELKFDGLVVSDWNGIDQLPGDRDQDVEQAINAGVDMVMAPDSYREVIASLKKNVQSGAIPMARIDEAVGRILIAKFRIGLFEKPFGNPKLVKAVGSAEHRAVARQAVRESMVLLVNRNNALPIAARASRIFVGGKAADDIGLQCGGWTISWQGSSGPITDGTTVLAAIKKAAPKADVTYDRSGKVSPGAEVAVIVIGEQPYAEMKGDKADLALEADDVQAVKNAKQAGIPVVVVLFSGRPLILEPILDDVDALVAAWLPGTEGDGIADVLFGRFNPTGRLSVTWPRSMSQVPINVSPDGEKPEGALFDYGFGLSYRR